MTSIPNLAKTALTNPGPAPNSRTVLDVISLYALYALIKCKKKRTDYNS
jgi:hypothetical protein